MLIQENLSRGGGYFYNLLGGGLRLQDVKRCGRGFQGVACAEKECFMKVRIDAAKLAGWQELPATLSLSLSLALLAPAFGVIARSQEPPNSAQSVADAARNARERKSDSTTPAKVFTNDDLVGQSSAIPAPLGNAASPPEPQSKQAEAPTPQTTNCDNPDDDRLKTELQAAQDELDQLRRELSYDPKPISDGDVDLKNFKPGSSGLSFGSPPFSQAQPQVPGRVQEAILEDRIAALKKASTIACDSPKDAAIQTKIDSAEEQLKLLQREFNLDQSAYYSKSDHAGDASGKAKLDAEQQQIESLQSDIDRLKDELPSPKTDQAAQ